MLDASLGPSIYMLSHKYNSQNVIMEDAEDGVSSAVVQTLILFFPSLFKFFQLSWILLKYLQFSKLPWELLIKHAKPSSLSSCGSLAGESLWTLPKWKQRDWFSAFGHLEEFAFPRGDLHLHLFFFSELWNMFDRLYVNPLRNCLVWLLWCFILPT